MEKINNLINIVLLLAIIQGFIFNIIIHIKNKPRNRAILYLNLTIFLFTLNNLQSYLLKKDLIPFSTFIKYTIIDVSWNIFIAPFFFMFLIHFLKIEKHYRYVVTTTLVIFFGLVIIRIIIFFSFKDIINNSDFIHFIRRYNSYEDIFIILGTIAVFSYCVYLFYKLKDRFKYINSFNNLKWLHTFYILTTVTLFLWLIAIILDFNYLTLKTANIYTPLRLVTSFLIYWLGYQGYNQYLLTKDRILLRTALQEDSSMIVLQNSKTLSEDEYLEFKKIKKVIASKKLFLNPLLGLSSLAKELDTNTTYLSKLINVYSNYNFADFINNFRIEYAKQVLLDAKYTAYTIVAIGLECGFNSKSTFYTAFKKGTGQTPVLYRKNNK